VRKKQSRPNEILQLNDFPYPIKKRCGSENTSIIGYEMSIDIVPHFVAHGPCETFQDYKVKKSVRLSLLPKYGIVHRSLNLLPFARATK
jgi:hypothetical protein